MTEASKDRFAAIERVIRGNVRGDFSDEKAALTELTEAREHIREIEEREAKWRDEALTAIMWIRDSYAHEGTDTWRLLNMAMEKLSLGIERERLNPKGGDAQ